MKRRISYQAILIALGLVALPILLWKNFGILRPPSVHMDDPESVRWDGQNPERVPLAIRFPNADLDWPKGHPDFQIEPWMQPQLNFWIEVFTRFTSKQAVLHDARHVDRVFEIIPIDGLTREQTDQQLETARNRWRDILLSVAEKESEPTRMNAIESRVFRMYLGVNEADKFRAVTQPGRLRAQTGLRDSFQRAIRESGKYLPMIEEIFEKNDLPRELTRLPFVESGFVIGAHSKVGARGIWQFMRSTGRQYLKIDKGIDERLDPVRSTEAAARYLAFNYRTLQSWPLAVTAYNHGRGGVQRAVQSVQSTEIRRIIEEYQSPSFGFASRNFYLSLLAAIEVERNAEKYFGPIERHPPLDYVEVGIAHYVRTSDLIRFLNLDEERFKALNPGFNDQIWSGRVQIPAGYRIKIPTDWGGDQRGAREAFWTAYNSMPDEVKSRRRAK